MDTAEELRKKNIVDLNVILMELLKNHFELRMQHKSGELSDVTKLSKVKKAIARVKTIMKEKDL